MNGTILEKIIDAKRIRVSQAKINNDLSALAFAAHSVRDESEAHRLKHSLSRGSGLNIIAEFKRASPSKGVINDTIDPVRTALDYEEGGACAISVLTEEDFFKGSLDDLRSIRAAVEVPILRKDFFIDEFQIYEAAVAGADAILLIAAALSKSELVRFLKLTEQVLNMDAIVEVHTNAELAKAAEVGASIIGVNNRDLKTFNVSLDVSRKIVRQKPPGSVMIAESGITTKDEMLELRSLGFDGFLIGETLMRSGHARATLEAWV